MKVLFVAAKKGCGFAPFVEEQAQALRALAVEPAALDAGHLDAARLDATHLEKVEVVDYAHTAHGIANYMKWVPKLHKAIKEIKPNVVHAHFGLTGLLAGLAAIGTGVPVVVTYHGCDINDKKLRPFSRMAMRLAAWNIFVSKRQMVNAYGSETRAAKATKGGVMACGIDIRMFDKSQVDEAWYAEKFGKGDKVLFGGDFERAVKDPALAKVAIEELNKKINTQNTACAEINIENNIITKKEESEPIGTSSNNLDPKSAQKQAFGQPSAQSCSVSLTDSSEKNELLHNSQKNTKNGDADLELIEMKGYTREQVVTLMYKCKALLLTSIREGSPQVVKEAMACDCPIVSVDVGDVSERLEGLDGCFVVKSREPKELADALEKAIAFGRTKGRERLLADGLDNEQVAHKLIEIYKQVQ